MWQNWFGCGTIRGVKGSLVERSPGVWQIRVSMGKGPDGKYRRATRTVHTPRKREAQQALRAFVSEVEAAHRTPSRYEITIGEVIDRFVAMPRSPRTNRGYDSLARNLKIGGLAADNATVAVVESELRRIASMHGTATAVATFRLLRAAMNEAERLDLIRLSVVRKVRTPKHTQAAKVTISGEQIARIIARVQGDGRRDLAVLFRLAAMSGARRGELAALRWDDVDFERGQVTISRAISAGIEQGTKTGRVKTISLDAQTMTDLLAWRDACAVDAMALGLVAPEHVFRRAVDDPRPMHPDTISHQWARARAGIADGVRFHDLRHFAASQMLAAGVDVVTAAERQGHSPAVMLGVYAHALPERDRAAAEILADALK